MLVLFETGFKQISWRRDTSSSQIDTRQFHKEADFIAPYQQNWTKFKRPIRSTSSKMLSFRLGKYGIFLNEFLTYQLPWIFRFKMWHLQKTFKNISNIKSWHLTWNGPYSPFDFVSDKWRYNFCACVCVHACLKWLALLQNQEFSNSD